MCTFMTSVFRMENMPYRRHHILYIVHTVQQQWVNLCILVHRTNEIHLRIYNIHALSIHGHDANMLVFCCWRRMYTVN